MGKLTKIGVVTVTFNSAEVLKGFFESAFSQTFENFVLYLVDNASKDETIKLAAECSDSRLRIIKNRENVGVAEGNNQGIRQALDDGCDCILLLNNDTAFPSDTFDILLDGLVQHRCAMTTPKIYYHGAPNRIWAAGGYFQPALGYRVQHFGIDQEDSGQFDERRRVTYTPTCCVLIRREVFQKIGLMNPRYFVYLDDVDFMFRAMNAGFVLNYLPSCRLWHKVSYLSGHMSNFQARFCARNRAYFLRRNLAFWKALLWHKLYRTYYTARLVAGKDSFQSWKIKMTSSKEGWGLDSE